MIQLSYFFPILRNVKFLINSDPEKTTKKLLKLKRYFSNNFHKYFWVSQIISMQLCIFKMSCKKTWKKVMKTDNLFKTTLCRNVVCIEILETLTLQKHESLITIDSLLALLRLMTNSYCATRRQTTSERELSRLQVSVQVYWKLLSSIGTIGYVSALMSKAKVVSSSLTWSSFFYDISRHFQT